MNPVTHFLIGWELGCALRLGKRDCGLLVAASVLPDLDGLGVVLDWLAPGAGPSLYGSYHHFVLHGAFGALLAVALTVPFARRRLKVAVWVLVAFHLHLLGDLLGSRGPGAVAPWPLYYGGPFTREHAWAWSGQWALNAWPNVVLSLALLASTLARAARTGVSPTMFLGRHVDAAFLQTLAAWRARWQTRR